ncbi:hypothetical protein [Kitasatospora sp. A2-31]|uniref:hypothetical protein n=1 Tax=Kitasatospora sp. A2-31 TaxID=2916414 RepID=UPI001EEC92E2|nr:hypothetical protein [Kitasatospora sp. A2-31]MCG6498187.1 hypothetical protein [Kitasatospora sp. A2-31]
MLEDGAETMVERHAMRVAQLADPSTEELQLLVPGLRPRGRPRGSTAARRTDPVATTARSTTSDLTAADL